MHIRLIQIFVSSGSEAENSFYFLPLIILLRVTTSIVYDWMK